MNNSQIYECREGEEKSTAHERRIEAEANAEQQAAKEEAAKFEGCYTAILSTMLRLLPKTVQATSSLH